MVASATSTTARPNKGRMAVVVAGHPRPAAGTSALPCSVTSVNDLLLKSLILVGGALFATWGNPVIRFVLGRIDAAGRGPRDEVEVARENLGLVQAQADLPGGRWVGMLERLSAYVCIVSGFPAGIAMVLAVKGLGRYAELATSEPSSRKGELFIIGTFASLLWAGLWAGVAYWGVRLW